MCALCVLSPKMTSQQYGHDPGAEQQVIKKTKSPKISQTTMKSLSVRPDLSPYGSVFCSVVMTLSILHFLMYYLHEFSLKSSLRGRVCLPDIAIFFI